MAIFNTQYCGEATQQFGWWSPNMTAANSPAPYKVTAKGFTNSAFGYGEPYKAFDGNFSTGWYHSSSTGTWIQFDFGKDITLDGVRVRPVLDANSSSIPKNIKVVGILPDGTTTELFVLSPPNENVWTGKLIESPIKVQGIRLESQSGSYANTNYYIIGEIEFHSLV